MYFQPLVLVDDCRPVGFPWAQFLYHHPPRSLCAQFVVLSLSWSLSLNRSEKGLKYISNIFILDSLGREFHPIDVLGVSKKGVSKSGCGIIEPFQCQNIIISWTNLGGSRINYLIESSAIAILWSSVIFSFLRNGNELNPRPPPNAPTPNWINTQPFPFRAFLIN